MISNTGADGAAWSWQFHVTPSTIEQHLADHPGDRILDLDQYSIGVTTYFSAIYINNSGNHARAWWWYYNISASELASAIRRNGAMLVDVEPTGTGNFNVIMQRVPGGNAGWWWYVGVDGEFVANALGQNRGRLVTLKRWATLDGDRFAVVMIDNTGGARPPDQPPTPEPPPPAEGPRPGNCGGDYTGPGKVLVAELLRSVQYHVGCDTATPPFGRDWERFRDGPCVRDQYVAAAIVNAWGAKAYAYVAQMGLAREQARDMCQNLRNADQMCSNAPVFDNAIQCSTSNVYRCGPNGTPGKAQSCP